MIKYQRSNQNTCINQKPLVKVGDVIKWKSSKKDKVFVKTISEELSSRDIPDWLELNQEELEGKVIDLPEINEDELDLETRLIVEHYSR